MSYTFVGYQIVDNSAAPSSSVTVDLSSLTGGTRQSGDIAYVTPFAIRGTPAGHTWTAAGWTKYTGYDRRPANTLQNCGDVFEKVLTGAETTVTFTDGSSRVDTHGALVAVYRGISAASSYNTEDDPGYSSTTQATPWSAGALIVGSTSTSDVTSTIPTATNSLGAIRQFLFYIYIDMHGPASIVRSATDSNLVERFSLTAANQFIVWFDELWESASDYPSRAVSTHWSVGGNSYYCDMVRFHSSSDQNIPGAGADHWAHAEGSDDMDSWQLVG